MNKKELGEKGETIAVSYLQGSGYTILDRNVTNKIGEIDIIAKDRDTICFVEVRTKTSEDQGHPLESITPRKQSQLIRTATRYLQEKELLDENARFDVMSVQLLDDPDCPTIELVKNAFEAD